MEDFREVQGKTSWIAGRLTRRRRVSLGAWGEWVALSYLRKLKGWEIVARNWSTARGEIDLIAFDRNTLVFLEVKTKKTPSLFPPESNVDEEKKNQLERLAYDFLVHYEIDDTAIRFDLVAIESPHLRTFTLRHYLGFM